MIFLPYTQERKKERKKEYILKSDILSYTKERKKVEAKKNIYKKVIFYHTHKIDR